MEPQASQCICPGPAAPSPFDAAYDIDCPIHGELAGAIVVDAIDSGRAIQAQPPGRCELCGAVKETRPYGPNGEEVCHPCGVKDEDAMKRQFAKRMGWST